MLIYQHFLLSLIPSIILFYYYGWGVWIFIAVNVLIDVDHYPVYVWKFKTISFKKAYIYFKNIKKPDDIAIFHTFEFLILILILSFFYKIFFLVFLALLFHLILDIYDAHIRNIKRPFTLIFGKKGILKRIENLL